MTPADYLNRQAAHRPINPAATPGQEPHPDPDLSFLLSISASQAPRFRDALLKAGLDIDLLNMLVAFDEADPPRITINRSSDLQNMLDTVNNYLEVHHLQPKFPSNPNSWNLPKRQEFLNLMTIRFDWNDFQPLTPWNEIDPAPWDTVAASHPALFN